jgi:hypothetical protein
VLRVASNAGEPLNPEVARWTERALPVPSRPAPRGETRLCGRCNAGLRACRSRRFVAARAAGHGRHSPRVHTSRGEGYFVAALEPALVSRPGMGRSGNGELAAT